jgi:hypothetical protein
VDVANQVFFGTEEQLVRHVALRAGQRHLSVTINCSILGSAQSSPSRQPRIAVNMPLVSIGRSLSTQHLANLLGFLEGRFGHCTIAFISAKASKKAISDLRTSLIWTLEFFQPSRWLPGANSPLYPILSVS